MRDLAQHRVSASTLPDMLLSAADRYAQRPAVIFPDKVLSYADLVRNSYAQARNLRGLGVGPGDHVGILMANCPEYIEVLFGALMLGAMVVPLNARYKSPELAEVMRTFRSAFSIT